MDVHMGRRVIVRIDVTTEKLQAYSCFFKAYVHTELSRCQNDMDSPLRLPGKPVIGRRVVFDVLWIRLR